MARKRLTPHPFTETPPAAGSERRSVPLERTAEARASASRERPPIARVTGESAAEAALAELSGALDAARAEGRLVQALPLDTIVADHLVRDRLAADDEAMATLKASLAARGQQTPIEVVDLGAGRFGLLSGWRRLTALRALHEETGEDRFARIEALLRRPDSAADAYQAMIDENEIRVGLSHWERARVAAKAAELGLFPTARVAVRTLFATASRAKRSKVNSFLTLYEALEGALAHPAALPERLGLTLARAIEADSALAARLRAALARAAAEAPLDAAAEQEVLGKAAAASSDVPADPSAASRGAGPKRAGFAQAAAGSERPAPLSVVRRGRRLVIEGPGVDAALQAALEAWLAGRA